MPKVHRKNEVRRFVESTFPLVKKIKTSWITDKNLAEIEPSIVMERIAEISGKLKRVDGEKWDCDDIAKNATMHVRRWWKNNFTVDEPIAFGEAYGMRFRGVDELHTVNIFIYDSRVYCVDLQLDYFWIANTLQDVVYKIDF
jgi:hypothetical protein